MKRLLFLGGLALALVTAGCVVASVYPFYTKKDLTFDPALVGTWKDSVEGTNLSSQAWVFEKAAENAYTFNVTSSHETNSFYAHLFKIKDHLFIDFMPLEIQDDAIPPHYLMQVEQIEPTLKTRWMKSEWLAKLLEKNPEAIKHVVIYDIGDTNKNRFVLTAEPKELQKFVLKHLKNEEAFTEVIEMHKLQGK